MGIKARLLGAWVLVPLLSGTSLAASGSDLRLVEAVKARDKDAVRSLLNQRVDVNLRQPDGATALHWAVHWNDLDTADLLIRALANVSATNDYGTTPLSLACTNGSALMVEKLLVAGANPNAALPTGETVLMTCAHTGNVEAVKLLLGHGADVNAKESRRGQTALTRAVAEKHADVAKVLIEHGAEAHVRTNGGFTPLLFAARVGDVESAKLLLEGGADVNEVTSDSMSALVLASASGQEAVAIFLLEKGANPNAADANGVTALHYSLMKGLVSLNGSYFLNYLTYLYRPGMKELVKALLAHGANPNAQIVKSPFVGGRTGAGVIGATPFLLAAASADPAVMRMLVAAGADPLLPTKVGMTPLMVAAGLGRGHDRNEEDQRNALEAVKIAVELGNDVDAAEQNGGRTALHGAAYTGGDEIVQFLWERGAKVDAKDKKGETPWSVAEALNNPGDVHHKSTGDLLLKLGATRLTAADFPPPSSAAEGSSYGAPDAQTKKGLDSEGPRSVPKSGAD
jgi:ankyrin repeat protein